MRSNHTSEDPWSVLGVNPGAEDEVVKAAYRALAKKYHPDRNPAPESSAIFMRVSEAFREIKSGRDGSMPSLWSGRGEVASDHRPSWFRSIGIVFERVFDGVAPNGYDYIPRTDPVSEKTGDAAGFLECLDAVLRARAFAGFIRGDGRNQGRSRGKAGR